MLKTLTIVIALVLLATRTSLATIESPDNSIAVPTVSSDPALLGDLSNPDWAKAAKVSLRYDIHGHQAAQQVTTAYVFTDGKYLYVGFEARQSNRIVAAQHTDDVGLDTDDEVQIDLWPGGNQGFSYYFISTPLGTHYQFSSENTAYAPTWWSTGKVYDGRFIVTMKIPLDIMRGASHKPWRVQFARLVQGTREDLVWTGSGTQSTHNDVNYSGYLTGIDPRAQRPKPRAEIYTLGALDGKSIGGDTSRVGADLALPFTSTASFLATLHPDYSNVELDQQTISPTAYRRFLTEARPFFTQGAGFYNPFNCAGCPGVQELYTPNVPTPSQGYAIEGKQGQFNFAGYDAIRTSRNDNAESLYWRTQDRQVVIAMQRVATTMPGLADATTTTGVSWGNNKNAFAYFNYGSDNGTNVLRADDAQRYDAGGGLILPNDSLVVSERKIGDFYNPVDGIIQHPGIAGYNVNGNHQLIFPTTSWLHSVNLYGSLDRYHGANDGLNQTDNQIGLDILTRQLLELNVQSGSSYLRLTDGNFSPITQNAETLTWHSGSATPTVFALTSGHFGAGTVDSWTRSSTMRLGMRGSLTLEADDTVQYRASGPPLTQWLERFGFAYQSGRTESIAIGLRRIIGTPPMFDSPSSSVNAWNVSFAYHKHLAHDDVYAIYGDPSQISTVPQFIIKLVHYIGADKGT